MPRNASDRPFVLLNMSMSADGKIASTDRRINHFTGKRDERNLYALRATVDAIMNGARTVDTAPIRMDSEHDAVRVIVTGSGTLDPEAEVFRHRFSPIIILTSSRCPQRKLQQLKPLADGVIVSPTKDIDFAGAMKHLRRKWNVRRLLCEGGGGLNDAMFRADLIDEVHLTVSPLIIGGAEAPTISDGRGFDSLNDARKFRLVKRRQLGEEMFLTYRRK